VDGVSTLDALIGSGVSNIKIQTEEDNTMALTIEQVKADAALYASICAEVEKASYEKGLADGKAAEVARIQGVKAQAMAGHEKLIEEMMFDGKTTGEQAAVKIVAAEKAVKDAALEAMKNGMQASVPQVPPPAGGQGKKGFMAMVESHMAENKCSKGDAIKAVARLHPELHDEFINGGK